MQGFYTALHNRGCKQEPAEGHTRIYPWLTYLLTSLLSWMLSKLRGLLKPEQHRFNPVVTGRPREQIVRFCKMLRTAANDNPTDWPNRLPALLAADRMTVHKVTQVTPNMAMLGKEVLFPTTLIANPSTEEPLVSTSTHSYSQLPTQ